MQVYGRVQVLINYTNIYGLNQATKLARERVFVHCVSLNVYNQSVLFWKEKKEAQTYLNIYIKHKESISSHSLKDAY